MHLATSSKSIIIMGTINEIIEYLNSFPPETTLKEYIKQHLH